MQRNRWARTPAPAAHRLRPACSTKICTSAACAAATKRARNTAKPPRQAIRAGGAASPCSRVDAKTALRFTEPSEGPRATGFLAGETQMGRRGARSGTRVQQACRKAPSEFCWQPVAQAIKVTLQFPRPARPEQLPATSTLAGGGGACSVLASKVLLPCVAAEQCAFAWMWTVEGARGVPSARPHQHTCGRAAAGSARPQGGESATTDPPTHPSRSDAGGEVPAIHAPPRGLYNSEGSASALSHLNRLERKSKQVMDANNHAGGCRTPMCVASWTGIAVFAAALLAAAAAGGQRLAPAPAPTAGRASAGARPAITCRWST